MGATSEMVDSCVLYGRILIGAQTAFILQNVFQSFFVVAEKPGLSLKLSIAAGLTNFIFDFLFIAVFQWGVAGAAAATDVYKRQDFELMQMVKQECENGEETVDEALKPLFRQPDITRWNFYQADESQYSFSPEDYEACRAKLIRALADARKSRAERGASV